MAAVGQAGRSGVEGSAPAPCRRDLSRIPVHRSLPMLDAHPAPAAPAAVPAPAPFSNPLPPGRSPGPHPRRCWPPPKPCCRSSKPAGHSMPARCARP